ncbi:MAG TPA: hypothetical protein DDW65_22010 [Firmicutes bacterium]|nr:hypothetical protein [Bacillota bacterium]
MKYLFVLQKVNQNYAAYVPDLPGCVASGKTADEARKAMKMAVEWHLHGLAADGLPIPAPAIQDDYDPKQHSKSKAKTETNATETAKTPTGPAKRFKFFKS